MQPSVEGKTVRVNRELTELDKFAIVFTKCLEKTKIRYCVVSGFVAIALGRSRGTEDIDVIAEKIHFTKFEELWNCVSPKLECINASGAREAFDDYLEEGLSLRFSEENEPVPNIEFKFSQNAVQEYAIANPRTLEIGGASFKIGPLEQQVAYKLLLGSENDLEDARFIFRLLEDKLDSRALLGWCERLKVTEKLKLIGVGK